MVPTARDLVPPKISVLERFTGPPLETGNSDIDHARGTFEIVSEGHRPRFPGTPSPYPSLAKRLTRGYRFVTEQYAKRATT